MLVRFRVENFRSLRDMAELSLIATSLKHSGARPLEAAGIPRGLLRAAALYGANASGKSNVLKAISFFISAIAYSHTNWKPEGPIPVQPFLLDESKEKPSLFETDFVLNETRYRYGFVVDSKAVLEEWLYAFPPGAKIKRQLWFTREKDREPAFIFGRNLPGENRVIEKITRPNSLFLSAAAQNNHQTLLPIYEWLTKRITIMAGPRRQSNSKTIELCDNEKAKNSMMRLLGPADLGVTNIRVIDESLSDESKKLMQAIQEIFSKDGKTVAVPEKMPRVELLHSNKAGADVPLRIEDESDGTASFFSLLGPVVEVLGSGGVLCVDELEASLHPLLSLAILRLFLTSETNPGKAQLVFNTHDTNLLGETMLRRDEIWFTEKDKEGCTHLYPLTDFRTRRNESLKRGYLQGRFGAVPFLTFDDHSRSKESE